MTKKLKTYETSLGFFDLAIAAPSMKAALEAWGADSNLFHQGAAKQSEDPDVLAATTAKPGVVLKRPVGSNGPFKEHAELPRDLAVAGGAKKAARKAPSRKPQKNAKKIDEAEDRKAALAFEKEQARREHERAKEEAAQCKQRERRQKDVDKAQSALDAARRSHDRDAARRSSQDRRSPRAVSGGRSAMGKGAVQTRGRAAAGSRVADAVQL